MPCIEDWSGKPLNIVQNIFDNRKDKLKWIDQVTEYFDDRLKTSSSLIELLSLNGTQLHDLPSGCLVSFRCMIQETNEPEYYMEKYEVKNNVDGTSEICSAAFKDTLDFPDEYDIVSNTMGCRQVLYCVSIPGETAWVKKTYQSHKPSTSASYHVVDGEGLIAGKRSYEDDSELMEQDQPMTNGLDHNKRQKRSSDADRETKMPLKKNHPLPDEDGAVCIVKIYDEEKDFKINEVYEFVGVLSMDSSLEYVQDLEDQVMAASAEEHRAHHPPPSFAPRLHCVHMKKLDHNNPLLLDNSVLGDISRLSMKNELLKFLKQATFGDELAAEYLLMHMTSRVYSRSGALPVGKFSLNISNVPTDTKYPAYLSHLVEQLLTKVFIFPMTLDNLNKLTFIPTKNYTTNKLESGIFQLSDGTHIVVDETVLKPGQLDPNGVKHVQAFSNLLNFQKVDYNFQFHPLSFDHDVPVLILSEGKSLLPCDCQVSLSSTIPAPEDLKNHFEKLDLAPELLNKFRAYITISKLADYELGEDMMKVIENDFVAARQARNDKMTPDDLHLYLIVARLSSINAGLKNLTLETWRKVGQLETSRRSRLTQH